MDKFIEWTKTADVPEIAGVISAAAAVVALLWAVFVYLRPKPPDAKLSKKPGGPEPLDKGPSQWASPIKLATEEEVKKHDPAYQRLARKIVAKDGSIAVGGDIKGSTVNIGTRIEVGDLVDLVKAAKGDDSLLGRIEVLSAELGITKNAITNMFRILDEKEVPAEQLDAKLRNIAESHLETKSQLLASLKRSDGQEVLRRRERAAETLEDGDYDSAADLLREAAAIDREAADSRHFSAAVTLFQLGQLERTRLNYQQAANCFAEAASLLTSRDSEQRYDCLMMQARTLFDHGFEFGDAPALHEAITVLRTVIEENPREQQPSYWATAHSNLGYALKVLGERKGSTAFLEEAITTFNLALEESTQEATPSQWTKVQVGLGSALTSLGELDNDPDRLRTAIAAFRHALRGLEPETDPLDWALTQNNLSNALTILWEMNQEPELLEEAIKTYDAALEMLPRKSEPLEWARIQNNLGLVFQALGDYEHSEARFRQAIGAYCLALEEWTRERVPLDWATAQHNLGISLSALGMGEDNTACFKEALAAFRLAVQERTRERVPLEWATTQTHIGNVLWHLAQREGGGTTYLEESVAALQQALKERTREHTPLDWAATKTVVSAALQTLGERTGLKSHLEEALEAARDALGVYAQQAGLIERQASSGLEARITALEAAVAN